MVLAADLSPDDGVFQSSMTTGRLAKHICMKQQNKVCILDYVLDLCNNLLQHTLVTWMSTEPEQ